MNSPTQTGAVGAKTSEGQEIELHWRNVPVVLVDQLIGFAAADGIARFTLGELAYTPGGGTPHVRPVITLATSADGLNRLTIQLAEMARQLMIEEGGDIPNSEATAGETDTTRG